MCWFYQVDELLQLLIQDVRTAAGSTAAASGLLSGSLRGAASSVVDGGSISRQLVTETNKRV